jgi:hypothetical protein
VSDNKADTIWRLQAQFDINGLIQALKDPNAAIRKRAAAALRTINATQATPALKEALEVETDVDTRDSLVAALEILDTSSSTTPADQPKSVTIKNLVKKLTSGDIQEATDAAKELGENGDKTAVPELIFTFNDMRTPVSVRLAVADALLKLESAPVEVALLANLRHEDWHIRRNGAAILGQLKAEWAVEPLGVALTDPHPTVRKTALAALKYIGSPEARKTLAKYATGQISRKTDNLRPPASPAPPPAKMPQKSRLLDKGNPSATTESEVPTVEPKTLPKDIEVKKVSEQRERPKETDAHLSHTSQLKDSVVDEYKNRNKPDNDSAQGE